MLHTWGTRNIELLTNARLVRRPKNNKIVSLRPHPNIYFIGLTYLADGFVGQSGKCLILTDYHFSRDEQIACGYDG